jgi:hypothetical protein
MGRYSKDMGRYSKVGIDTRLRTGRAGVPIPVEARDFSLLQTVQTVSTQPPIQRAPPFGVKAAGASS